MRKGLKVFLSIVLIIVVVSVIAYVGGTKNMDEIVDFEMPLIDLSSIDDGSYQGSCDIGRWALTVDIMIKNHQIVNVIMAEKHLSNVTPELAEIWNKSIVFTDTPSFDAVTGATITSKAYMIAITDALKQ
jgi:uncharacterized protein with FMN-binding domain